MIQKTQLPMNDPVELTRFKEKDHSYFQSELNNPWDVSNASEFLKYCCPECDFKSGELDDFSQHAIENHVLSNTLFNPGNFSEFKDFDSKCDDTNAVFDEEKSIETPDHGNLLRSIDNKNVTIVTQTVV